MAERQDRFCKCGNEWRYCDGVCSQCYLWKIFYSTTTDTPNEKNDFKERENMGIPQKE